MRNIYIKHRMWMACSCKNWEKPLIVKWFAPFYDGFVRRMSRPTTPLSTWQVISWSSILSIRISFLFVWNRSSSYNVTTSVCFLRFDNGGPGACLKRYSDPTFFEKAWDMLSKVKNAENAHKEKHHKIKVIVLITAYFSLIFSH